MIQATVTVIATSDDRLLIPADQFTSLLREFAAEWLHWPEDPQLDLDGPTIHTIVGVLDEFADQVDAECIGMVTRARA